MLVSLLERKHIITDQDIEKIKNSLKDTFVTKEEIPLYRIVLGNHEERIKLLEKYQFG